MHETGCSGLVHWDDPEGWDGEGGSGWGTHVHPWLIHVNVWQKPPQYCKVISLQLKKKRCYESSAGFVKQKHEVSLIFLNVLTYIS